MEFDTSVKLKSKGSYHSSSTMEMEPFCLKIWNLLSPTVKHAADSGAGEFWLDYSDFMRTKHIVVNIEKEESGYDIKFRAGTRPGRFADILLIVFILLLFWTLGKVLVPSPDPLVIAGLCCAVVGLVVVLLLIYGRTFGEKETAQLLDKLRSEDV